MLSERLKCWRVCNFAADKMRNEATQLKDWQVKIADLNARLAPDDRQQQLAAEVQQAEALKASAKTKVEQVRSGKDALTKRKAKARGTSRLASRSV